MLSFLHQALGSKTSFNKRHISSLHSNSNTVGTASYLKSWCRWREGSFRVLKLFWLITRRLLHQLWRRCTVCIPNQSYTSFKLFANIFFKVASLLYIGIGYTVWQDFALRFSAETCFPHYILHWLYINTIVTIKNNIQYIIHILVRSTSYSYIYTVY